jgi:hypothetical protein
MKNKVKNNSEEPKAAMYQNQVRLVGFLGRNPEEYENRSILSVATKKSWKKPDSDEWDSHTSGIASWSGTSWPKASTLSPRAITYWSKGSCAVVPT